MDTLHDSDSPVAADDSQFLVVGIGASAGGLEALEHFFHSLPPRSGMAFVVIQHLSPDFESRMPELLGRQVSVPIHLVTDQMEVHPNAIYFIPPRKEMIISGGRLLLTEREDLHGFSLPIDHFFRSLANDMRRRSVAVVLSGAGSDGSRGIREVHESGGLVISQSPETARFQGMPLSARQTGIVDLVLRPEEIPAALAKHAAEVGPHMAQDEAAADCDTRPPAGSGLDQILRVLHAAHGIDFAFYKPSTVVRRVERRLALAGQTDVESYARLLSSNTAEANALYKDLLIGVTAFFRDPDAFAELQRNAIPEIIARTPSDQEIRVWVAGCATGEEPYSLAMVFHEQLLAAGRAPNVRIFATDVHRASLDHASAGLYEDAVLESLDPARRERYFTREGHRWRVAKELRQLVVFAQHNVISDAPFTRLDLVTCRNLLIYFQPAVQRKVLSLFHFGLKTRGIMVLGPSETTGDLSDEFDVLDGHWKILAKRRELRIRDARLPAYAIATTQGRERAPYPLAVSNSNMLQVYDQVLDRVMPGGIIVDEHHHLVHAFAGAEKLLRLKAGRPSMSILDLVEDSLKTALLAALQHAQKSGKAVQYEGITLTTEEGRATVQVAVEPLGTALGRTSHYLVRITPSQQVEAEAPESVRHNSDDYVQSLEVELRFAKENLQATIEELETANEELQATNEELVASNEELQSTNEELHSVNEELHTVNVEHQRKIAQLTEMTDDLDNLLHSLDVGVIFLDESLTIRKFTAQMARVFRLIPQDVGRRLDSFAHSLKYGSLQEDVQQVLRTHAPLQRTVTSAEGIIYLLRVLPYRGKAGQGGVLVTTVDVSELKQSEARVRRLSNVVESSQDAILALDLDGKISAWNRGAELLYQYTSEEAVGRPVTLVTPEQLHEELASVIDRVKRLEQVEPYESIGLRKDGHRFDVWMTVSPIYDEHNVVVGISTIGRDITMRKQQETEVREALKMREEFLAMLSHELRNPLAALLNASGLLQRQNLGADKQRHGMQVIERQCNHMARLLDDLLDVSRMRQGGIDLRRQRIDLRSTIQTAAERVRVMAEESGVRLEIELPAEPAWIQADPDRLQQVEVNLLTNAIKHTPTGRGVRLSLSADDARAEIHVEDEGVGVEPKMLEKIFEPFVRAAKPLHGSRQASAGLGLGLALVKSIVEGHGGQVHAESRGAGQGSCFVVRLPMNQEQSLASSEAVYPTTGAAKERTVVLVEDQEDSREVLRTYLDSDGWKVSVAGEGATALEVILRERPETAVIDIGLPDMSGIEVAKSIRQSLGADGPFLIALTGYGQQRDHQEILKAGFDHHLVKPVPIARLVELMRLRPKRGQAPA